MADKTTEFFTGEIMWCKVLGPPVDNFNKDGKEWTIELILNDASKAILKKHKLTDRIKEKDYGDVIILKQSATPWPDGKERDPIRVYDANDVDWDRDVKIGNKSVVDVKVSIVDNGKGRFKGVYPQAIRVRDHVAYESSEFGRMGPVDNVPAAEKKQDSFKADFGLDDEIPL